MATRAGRCGLPPCRSRWAHSRCSLRRRKASWTSTSRRDRRARRFVTSSPTPLGSPSTARSRSRSRERAASTRTRASACSAAHLAEKAEMPFADYVQAAVCVPLGIALDPHGDPGSGMQASLDDVLAVARELLTPTLVAPETLAEMTSVQFPGLSGVLPDFGRFDPLDWGLGVQLNTEPRAWMGSLTSPRTFGHFGGSGTFVWVDPVARVACAALSTATSATGRRRRGRRSRTPCSARPPASVSRRLRRAGGRARRTSPRRSSRRRTTSSR